MIRIAHNAALFCLAGPLGIASADAPVIGFDPVQDWIFDPGPGGSGELTSQVMTITGGKGEGRGNTEYIHAPALFAGTMSFEWSWVNLNVSTGFDFAYYVVGGEAELLSYGTFASGSIHDLPVAAGEAFGFRVTTTDGIFGPGLLTITNFTFKPIPTAGALFMAILVAIPRARRRC